MPPFKRAKRNPPTEPAAPENKPSTPAVTSPASTPLPSTPTLETALKQVPNESQVPAAVEEQDAKQIEKVAEQSQRHDRHQALDSQASLYGGTWPRTPSKAAPITQIARQSISCGGEALSKVVDNVKAKGGSLRNMSRPPSLYMAPGASTRSLPITGLTSKVNVSTPKLGETTSHIALDGQTSKNDIEDHKGESADGTDPSPSRLHVESSEPIRQTEDDCDIQTTKNEHPGAADPIGWTSWIPGYRQADGQAAGSLAPPVLASQGPAGEGKSEPIVPVPGASLVTQAIEAHEAKSDSEFTTSKPPVQQQLSARPRSWFGLWNADGSRAEPSQPKADISLSQHNADLPQKPADTERTRAIDDASQTPEAQAAATSVALEEAENTRHSKGSRPSSWAFWSLGPVAQSAKESENIGAAASIDREPPAGSSSKDTTSATSAKLGTPRKRERPISLETPSTPREDRISKHTPDGKTSATAAVNILPEETPTKPEDKPATRQPLNLLLPSLKHTYSAAESPGLFEQLARYFYPTRAPPVRHVHLVKDAPGVKHALAIGVHGYFPAPFLRTVIGQPRGTSIRFATNAAEAINNWCQKHGCKPQVEKITLEGEGKIEERVELLWNLLLKYIEKIRSADFILVACHSQGVPVAVQLVAKLIAFGCLTQARVGICAMAGVNLGPFPDYRSRWIGGSAGELFEFADPASRVSTDYEAALATCLKAGVKVTLVGSIDDQLVSMESATFGPVDHPCLYRAVFINSAVHAPTFLVHLVGFALKLRNLGVPEHGLIRELSSSLAGSFTGDGHSRLYEDPQLYDLSVEYALETSECANVPLSLRKSQPTLTSGATVNPYILPFAMRGVLEEDFVRSELKEEMMDLLTQFDDWKPTTKPLKDVKFRLEGIRSKM